MKKFWSEYWEVTCMTLLVMFLVGYGAYTIGKVRALHEFQKEAVERGYGHYEAAEAPAYFRWNKP